MPLKDNLDTIKEAVHFACNKAGRTVSDVKIIAVTKTVDVKTINEAISLGLFDLGENRVQELMEKYDKVDKRAKWHIIGHLQTNKVKYIADKVSMIHSVDSLKLACEIDKHCKKLNKVMDILIEVNSGEENKNGIPYSEVHSLIRDISKLENVKIKGLMTMAPIWADEAKRRKVFARLNSLRLDILSKGYDNVDMEHLSMGMSNDYTEAILEGATLVRIGRALFKQ